MASRKYFDQTDGLGTKTPPLSPTKHAVNAKWRNAVDVAASFFSPNMTLAPDPSLVSSDTPTLDPLRAQILSFSNDVDGLRQVLITLGQSQLSQLVKEINATGFQYDLIERTPSIRVAKLLFSVGVKYNSPTILMRLLHHDMFKTTSLQLGSPKFGWSDGPGSIRALRSNAFELSTMNDWLTWLMFTVKVDAFSPSPLIGTDPINYFGSTADALWRTPAFDAVIPIGQKANLNHMFKPAFYWFVRHFGNFLAGIIDGVKWRVLDLYLTQIQGPSEAEIASYMAALVAMCPEQLSLTDLPEWVAEKADLTGTISIIVRKGGASAAILRVPGAPGEYHNEYGNTALNNGNLTFLKECPALFGQAATFTLMDPDILPYVRIDAIPFLLRSIPKSQDSKLQQMIDRMPREYAVNFVLTYQDELIDRQVALVRLSGSSKTERQTAAYPSRSRRTGDFPRSPYKG